MARLNFYQMMADIQRMPALGNVSLGVVKDKLVMAAKDIGNQAWPWNYAETNVLVPAPYSTGTISITDGTNTVTGAGTTWNTGWYGYRIRFGNSNLDYLISTIGGPTSITLAQNVNLGQNLAGSSYTLYQDTYQYPSDYIFGSDVALLQPTIRSRIRKIPRYKYEMIMNAGLRTMSTNIQMYYCDNGFDRTNNVYTFRLGPPPAGVAELRLAYHRMAADLTDPWSTSSPPIGTFASSAFSFGTDLPEGYDEIITLVAASKLYDMLKLPQQSVMIKGIADGKIRLLKRLVATQTTDDIPDPQYEVPDSSISQWGMMISRM